MESRDADILTIGHSTHTLETFIGLLRGAGVTALADVRSIPYSRHMARFNREALADALSPHAIAYVHLGAELGGRPADPALYRQGRADYEKVARTEEFAAGLDRVMAGAERYRIALMCAERDPLDCHRCLLVSRALKERGVRVGHILADGRIRAHEEIEAELLEMAGDDPGQTDFLASGTERLANAYRHRLAGGRRARTRRDGMRAPE